MLCPLLVPFPDVCHSQHQVGSSPRARNSFLMYHRRVRVPATWTVICSLPVIRGNSAEAKNVCFLGPRESQCQDSVWHCAVGYGSAAGLCPAVRPCVAVLIHLQHCVGTAEYYHGPCQSPPCAAFTGACSQRLFSVGLLYIYHAAPSSSFLTSFSKVLPVHSGLLHLGLVAAGLFSCVSV